MSVYTFGLDISGLKYFTDARYDQTSGNLMLFYNDGKYINVNIPTSELVADIRYEEDTHRLSVVIARSFTFAVVTEDSSRCRS